MTIQNQNYSRNAATVGSSLGALRCDFSGLTTTSSFRTAAYPNGGGTASATAGAEYGEVDTAGVVSHYIPALPGHKIILWRISGNTGTGGQASTVFTFESNIGTTFYQVGRIAAAISTAAAFEVPIVSTAMNMNDHAPLAVGFTDGCLKVKMAVASISDTPIAVCYSYVRDLVSNQ